MVSSRVHVHVHSPSRQATHNHRPRGDTTWRAQTDTHTKHRREQTQKGRECQGSEGRAAVSRAHLTQTLPARVYMYRSIDGKPPRCLARGSSSLGFLSNKPLDLNPFTFIRRLHVHPCTFIGGPGAGRARHDSPIAPTTQARGLLLAVESTREGPRACLFKLLLLWVFVNLNCRANVRTLASCFCRRRSCLKVIMKSC